MAEHFELGDLVETAKGARFRGRIIGFDNDTERPGCTVLAIDPFFAGTKHVYPLAQLKPMEGHALTDAGAFLNDMLKAFDAFLGGLDPGLFAGGWKNNDLRDIIRRASSDLGSLRHAASVATIGHEQLNRLIRILDAAGFRGHGIDRQVELCAARVKEVRAEVETLRATEPEA